MIDNDDQLEVVRKQLATVEAALIALRRRMLPQHEGQYRIFAEGYIEQILELRAEMDQYLGITTAPPIPSEVQSGAGNRAEDGSPERHSTPNV
jgi:hypothetical protein